MYLLSTLRPRRRPWTGPLWNQPGLRGVELGRVARQPPTSERVTAPGVGLPWAVTRTRLPDSAAGLRAEGQTQGGSGLEHLAIGVRRSASVAAVVTRRNEHPTAELAGIS